MPNQALQQTGAASRLSGVHRRSAAPAAELGRSAGTTASGVPRFWNEIDLHVAAMLLMLAPAACLGWWGLAVPLLLPQGRIAARVFVDCPAFQRRPWAYFAANELLVGVLVAVAAVARVAAGG